MDPSNFHGEGMCVEDFLPCSYPYDEGQRLKDKRCVRSFVLTRHMYEAKQETMDTLCYMYNMVGEGGHVHEVRRSVVKAMYKGYICARYGCEGAGCARGAQP